MLFIGLLNLKGITVPNFTIGRRLCCVVCVCLYVCVCMCVYVWCVCGVCVCVCVCEGLSLNSIRSAGIHDTVVLKKGPLHLEIAHKALQICLT